MINPLARVVGALRLHPWRSAVLAVVVVVGTAAAGGYWWVGEQLRQAHRALDAEQFEEAERRIDRYLSVWDRNADAHLLAARIKRKRGQLTEAARHLREAHRLSGGATEAEQLEWVLLRAHAGDINQVEPGLWACLDNAHPESREIVKTLVDAHMNQSEFNLALRGLERWVQIEPDSPTPWFLRGWALERVANSPMPAVESYQKVLELDPKHVEARIRLAEIYLSQFKMDDAGSLLEGLAADGVARADVKCDLAQYRYLMGDLPGARRELDELLEKEPENVAGLRRRGALELQAGETAAAEKWLRRALQADPFNLETRFALWQSLTRQPGREAEAAQEQAQYDSEKVRHERMIALIRELIPREPNNPNLCAELADQFTRMKEFDRAAVWYQRALKGDPNHLQSHRGLAAYYEQRGDKELADWHRSFLKPRDQAAGGAVRR